MTGTSPAAGASRRRLVRALVIRPGLADRPGGRLGDLAGHAYPADLDVDGPDARQGRRHGDWRGAGPLRRAQAASRRGGGGAERRRPATLANDVTYQTQDLGAYRQGDNFGPVRVPKDAWFLLGDNRDAARDSRHDGVVAQKDICGVADRVLSSRDGQRIGRRP